MKFLSILHHILSKNKIIIITITTTHWFDLTIRVNNKQCLFINLIFLQEIHVAAQLIKACRASLRSRA